MIVTNFEGVISVWNELHASSFMANPLDDLEDMEITPFALMIPEILENIFQHSDERANRNCNILVCKAWSEPCMNAIWREVTDLYRLMKPLGPISRTFVRCFDSSLYKKNY